MIKDIAFGQYYPVKSFVHNLDARTKLFLTILYMISVFLVNGIFLFSVIFVMFILMVALSKIPLKSVLKTVKPVLILAVITAVLNLLLTDGAEGEQPIFTYRKIEIYMTGIYFTIRMMLRLVFLIVGASILTLTTTPVALTDAIEWFMYPLTYIKFPVKEIALIMSIALKFIPTLMEETGRIIRAQKARGVDFDSGGLVKKAKAYVPILIPLLVSSFRRADELALAMDARCYGYTAKRTKMKKMVFKLSDLVAFIVFVLFFAMIIVMRNGENIVIMGQKLVELCPWVFYGK